MTTHRRFMSLVFLAMLALPPLARDCVAQQIKTDPDPVQFGQSCRYFIDPPYQNGGSYRWEYNLTAPVQGPSRALSGVSADAATTLEDLPGTYEVRCFMTPQKSRDNPNPVELPPLTKTVVVPKPDGYTVSGTGVNTPLGSDCSIEFRITSGGVPANYVSGLAQESITNFVQYDQHGGKRYPDPSGWVPTSTTDPLYYRFKLSGGKIIDLKSYNESENTYTNRIPGSVLQALDQEIRIQFTYSGGFKDYATLTPKRRFTFKHVDNHTFKVD